MKHFLCLILLGGSALLTGCHEVVVDHHRHSRRGPAVVVRDQGYHRGPGYYDRRPGYYSRPGYHSTPRRSSGRVIVY